MSSTISRRALTALGALVIVAAVSVPTALAAMGTDADTTLAAPTVTATASIPSASAAAAAPTGIVASGAVASGLVDPDAVDPGSAIAAAIIERLTLPTGPVLRAAPPAPADPPSAVVPAATQVAAAPTPIAPAVEPESDRPARNRRPARADADDDRVEVEVYGAAIPEPPEVASSTTTETVLVEPDPADPWRAVRECESSGNYGTNTGNGFYGAYQFTIRTWNWVAGIIGRPDLIGVRPDLASPADQDRMANALAFEVRGGGLGHWPVCGRLYGS